MQRWFQDEGVDHNRRVSELTLKMLGDPPAAGEEASFPGGTIKLKAAEAGVALRFVVHELEQFGAGMDKMQELLACVWLISYYFGLPDSRRVYAVSLHQFLFEACCIVLACAIFFVTLANALCTSRRSITGELSKYSARG